MTSQLDATVTLLLFSGVGITLASLVTKGNRWPY
jgi:hypothetical protein